ncbi:MAG: radical SAM protein [Alphaproteobacteria bacterium]|nr:radical SAM protein [Alphaproteobacteria bacterium]
MWRALDALQNDPDLASTRAEHVRGGSPWLTSAKLKLVDGCNLRCFMCDYWKRDRSGELTTAEVLAILDDLAVLGCQKVHYTGGELFLRKDAVQLVAAAAERGMRTNLTTNGTALDKARLKDLLRVPVRSVTLSLDSPVNHVHDRIRGREGAWKRTVRTLDKLLERRGPKTRIRVNTVVSKRNVRTLVQMVPFLRERPIDGWLLIPVDGPEAMSEDDIRFYNARIAPVLAEATGVPDFDPWVYGRSDEDVSLGAKQRYARGYYDRKACHIPWFHTLIGPSGDVYPCCQTHRRMPPLGNVRTTPLREIFAGEAYRRLRARMLVERLPHCAECDDFTHENRAINDLLESRSLS